MHPAGCPGFLPLSALEFPTDGFSPGWKRSGPVETYAPSALYNVIDGGAELFLEMGFIDLQVQKYLGSGAEIAVEAYRMENAGRGPGHLPAQVQQGDAAARDRRPPQRRPFPDRLAEGRLFHFYQ